MIGRICFLLGWLGWTLIASSLHAQQDTKPMSQTQDPYARQWARIDSLEQKGFTRDALAATIALYDQAKAEGQDIQMVKAILYRMKFTNPLEEKADSLNIDLLKREIATANLPTRNILHSVLGEMYHSYYQQNRWRIMERTGVDVKPEDFQTWDVKTLMETAAEHYLASVSNAASLQLLSIADFEPLLRKGEESARYRPTLFDLLAHRAIDFFRESETWLATPAYEFELPAAIALAPAREFANAAFETRDTTSRILRAAQLMQEVLRFHLNSGNTYALVDADLKRLTFSHQQAVGELKDTLYLRALEQLLASHEDHPASALVSHQVARQYQQRAGNYDPHSGDAYKWDFRHAMEVCQQAIDRHPGSEGATQCQSLQAQIRQHNLELSAEEVNLASQPFRILIRYRNLQDLHFRVIAVTPSLREQINRYRYGSDDELARLLREQAVLHAWSLTLPEDPDYQSHALEMKVPPLDFGAYAVLASDDAGFGIEGHAMAFVFTQVSNLSYFTQTEKKNTEIYVRERESGKPVKKATVQVFRWNYKEGALEAASSPRSTGKDGKVSFSFDDTREYVLEIRKGDDTYRTDRIYDYYYRDYPEAAALKTHFFLDRTIYRPGQTIYFKGLLLRKEGDRHEIVKGKKTTVTFFDVNGKEVAKREVVSNEYGTFSGTFTAPRAGLLGQMYMQGENGSIYFRVEEYKRPKFEVTLEPLKGSYRLGEAVLAKGQAKAYAGSAIDGAEVRYRVVRRARFPYWGYFRWWMPTPASPEREIVSGVTTTDKEGRFEVPFTLVPDATVSRESKPIFTYTVYADVIDISGETRSGERALQAGYVALDVSLDLPQQLNRDALKPATLTTRNLSGEFEPAQGSIRVYRLQEPERILRKRRWARPDKFLYSKAEFVRLFPHDLYDNEDDFRSWEKGTPILDTDFNTAESKELEMGFLAAAKPGKYLIELLTRDSFGEEINVLQYTTLFEPDANTPALPVVLEAYPDKSTAEPGETVILTLSSSASKLDLVYFVEHNGKMLSKEPVKLKKATRIEIPVKENHRGGLKVSVAAIRHNEYHEQTFSIAVPWTNKQLQLSWETFRSVLRPGAEEEWKIKIAGPKGEAVAAEMVATLYDASLEAFSEPNSFGLNLYPSYWGKFSWRIGEGFGMGRSRVIASNWNPGYMRVKSHSYDELQTFGYQMGAVYYQRRFQRGAGGVDLMESQNMAFAAAPPAAMADSEGMMMQKSSEMEASADGVPDVYDQEQAPPAPEEQDGGLGEVPLRSNFNETAFFFPHLQTDEAGSVVLSFTMPEALTRWRMVGLAHTKDLAIGTIGGEVVTQKELMVMPNLPRFLRQGDRMRLTAKVSNLSDTLLQGSAQLFLLDAFTMQPVETKFALAAASQQFSAEAGQSAALAWEIQVPEGVQAVVTRIVARAGEFSDGEENVLPILTNRMLVTESLPLPLRGKQTREFAFDKLINSGASSTLRHQRLTLEFTSNPAWYAVQALPYLMEYPHECSEQIFSRLYANALASHIATSTPKIQRVFEQWRSRSESDEETRSALMSALENNQELKSVLLEETPWVLNASNERERKERIGLLFDLNRMADELARAKAKLGEMQYNNGAFPWFTGMPESRYITNLVATGMGHLSKLGVSTAAADPEVAQMTTRAVRYLDLQLKEDYDRLRSYRNFKPEENHLGYTQISYLYMRSFYPDLQLAEGTQEAYEYYYSQAKEFWPDQGNYMKGMLSLVFSRRNDLAIGKEVIESLRQNAIQHPELGMYWKQGGGWFWYQAPIEEQSLLIEAFDEVDKDRESVEAMKVWLLKNKQTNDWKTTRATVSACNALLMTGADLLASDQLVEVSLGGQVIDPYQRPDAKVEAGTGYYKTAWLRDEIRPEMGRVKVVKQDEGVAWGALYWQYFEDLDKITYAATPLSIQKKLFKEVVTEEGPKLLPIDKLVPGDKVIVRIELRVDRDMEYVHMKDQRSSGFEPINVLSQYKYQDGLGYYESTKDAATHFFFGFLRGNQTYVFEYPLRVTHEGDFSNGITTIQCMYAPEFTSHSEGIRVQVND